MALVNTIAILHSPEPYKIVRSFHFWIVITLIAVITIIYYEWSSWFPWFWRFFVFEFVNNIIGSLFLIPFIYASLVFWWRGSAMVWLVSQGAILPLLIDYRQLDRYWVSNSPCGSGSFL